MDPQHSHQPHPPAGLYIHVPFCIRKCPYCDFYSLADLTLKPAFLKALEKEMDLRPGDPLVFDTIYLGGGTPSLLEPGEIDAVINAALGRFSILPEAEITLEVNPGTVAEERLKAFRHAGVNRITIGVQSFQQDQLTALGRIHSVESAIATISAARDAGFENIGIDLIYGLPDQPASSVLLDLKQAVSFKPDHISCYLLTFEPATPFAAARDRGDLTPLGDAVTGDMFDAAVDFLTGNGYRQYEISNFAAASKFVSRHNRKYWDFTPYIGLGPSAHSFLPPARLWNHRDLHRYLFSIEKGETPTAGSETLTRAQQIMEAVYLGLRQTAGIPLEDFNVSLAADFLDMFHKPVEILQGDGMINLTSDRCRLTRKGMRFLDSVAAMLINGGSF